jgi:hypothetical protein
LQYFTFMEEGNEAIDRRKNTVAQKLNYQLKPRFSPVYLCFFIRCLNIFMSFFCPLFWFSVSFMSMCHSIII